MRVIKARFKSKEAFLKAYNDELPHGGMFCATTEPLQENEQVVIELHFPGLPNKMMARGTVLSWRAALPRLRVRAGAMVAFDSDFVENKNFILSVAAGESHSAVKRKHARLPVEMRVTWRTNYSREIHEGQLIDISIGGAQLVTEAPVELNTDVLIDILAPGGVRPVTIAGAITSRTPMGFGLQFIYRDAGGSRRLRELMRRLTRTDEE